MPFIALRIAARALARNRLRTILTLLGMAIGIAAVICTVALGQGSSALIQRQMQNSATTSSGSRTAAPTSAACAPEPPPWDKLTVEDSDAIAAEIPLVTRCSPNVDGRIQVVRSNQNWNNAVPRRVAQLSPDQSVAGDPRCAVHGGRRLGIAAASLFSDKPSSVCCSAKTIRSEARCVSAR